MKSKGHIIYFSILAALTVILCIAAYSAGQFSSIHSAASKQLSAETAQKQDEYNSLSESKKKLEEEISIASSEAQTNSDINIKMKNDEDKLSSLNSQVEAAKKTNENLTKQLEEKKALSSQVSSVSGTVKGKETKLKANTYSCPADIEAGTYAISAKEGNIIVYGTDSKIRVSKNLAATEGNSYTLTLRDGERIKFDKDVTIKGEGKVKSK